nr:hypothetical protein [Tanacetum cinerariifolium]
MDLKWQLVLLSVRTRQFFQKTGRKITINRSDTAGYDKSKPEFEGYGPKTSNSFSEDISNEVKESPDTSLVKELVSNDKLEKKGVFPTVTKIEFVRPKQQEKPVRKPVKYVVPTGRVIVPTGRYVVPTGRYVVPTDRVIVATGRTNYSTSRNNTYPTSTNYNTLPTGTTYLPVATITLPVGTTYLPVGTITLPFLDRSSILNLED